MNEIGDGGARELGMALRENSSLTRLHLGSNGIRDGGAREVALALKESSSLASLLMEVSLSLSHTHKLSLSLSFSRIWWRRQGRVAADEYLAVEWHW